MSRLVVFLYGLVAYGLFFVTFLYAIGFVAGVAVPKAINDGEAGGRPAAMAINVMLLGLFAIQHTIMARPSFKRWWTRIIPIAAERSTFVVIASGILLLVFWQWRPMVEVVWQVETPVLRIGLTAISMAGWAMVLYSSFLIDHFDLFGLRQVYLNLRERSYHHHPFMARSLYRVVRHPLMVGFIIAFWSTPTMTQGHLLFAAVTTAYILIGVRIEERDLVRMLGDDYRAYRERTPMFLPFTRRRPRGAAIVQSTP